MRTSKGQSLRGICQCDIFSKLIPKLIIRESRDSNSQMSDHNSTPTTRLWGFLTYYITLSKGCRVVNDYSGIKEKEKKNTVRRGSNPRPMNFGHVFAH